MRGATLSAVLLLLSGSGCAPSIALDQGPASEPRVPRFVETPCPFQADSSVLAQFRCGDLIVLENRADPRGRTLRLAVAVLASTSAEPRPDPLVFISGGPGSAAVETAPNAVVAPFRAERAMVFFDQRGTGRSQPRVCAALNQEWQDLLWLSGLDLEGRRAQQLRALEGCRREIEREGIDLSQYSSVATALDLEDLRQALGYGQWNLWGISYGSRVALEAMRTTPHGIRSVILDGPLPPNASSWTDRPASFSDALERLLARCAADPACNQAAPDVHARFWEAVESLERDPMVIRTAGRGGLPDPLTIDGGAFAGGVLGALYSSRMSVMVPLITREVANRNEAFVLAIAPQLRRPERLQRWLNLTVVCFENYPFRQTAARAVGDGAGSGVLRSIGVERDPALCEAWHPFRAGAEQGAPVVSDIPALIITGEFDPATHRAYGPLTAATLPNAQLVEIPGAGHVEAHANACTVQLMSSFLRDPLRRLETGCISAIAPLRFVTDPSMLLRAVSEQ